MTVSRVINREGNVRPLTSERVNDAIRELNYVPSPAARSLAGGEPYRIGVLYHNPSAGYLSEFLLGILDESSRTGTQVVVEKCAERDPAGPKLSKFLKSGVAGIILPPPLCESRTVQNKVRAAGMAVVAVAPGHPSQYMATVRIDNEAAAREITEHLISLGHRRIGYIAGNPNQTVSKQRLNGFLAALADAGIESRHAPIEQGYFTYRSGLEAAEKLLATRRRPTAIFAANDDMAAAASFVAHRLGLAVPADVSIVGFDDMPIALAVWPALTTIHQPVAKMARAAVDLVLEEIRRRHMGTAPAPRQLLYPHRLVTRESSGPAAAVSASAARKKST